MNEHYFYCEIRHPKKPEVSKYHVCVTTSAIEEDWNSSASKLRSRGMTEEIKTQETFPTIAAKELGWATCCSHFNLINQIGVEWKGHEPIQPCPKSETLGQPFRLDSDKKGIKLWVLTP